MRMQQRLGETASEAQAEKEKCGTLAIQARSLLHSGCAVSLRGSLVP